MAILAALRPHLYTLGSRTGSYLEIQKDGRPGTGITSNCYSHAQRPRLSIVLPVAWITFITLIRAVSPNREQNEYPSS